LARLNVVVFQEHLNHIFSSSTFWSRRRTITSSSLGKMGMKILKIWRKLTLKPDRFKRAPVTHLGKWMETVLLLGQEMASESSPQALLDIWRKIKIEMEQLSSSGNQKDVIRPFIQVQSAMSALQGHQSHPNAVTNSA
jgi:hypothetical protein